MYIKYILNGIIMASSGSMLFLVSTDLFKYYFYKNPIKQRSLRNFW